MVKGIAWVFMRKPFKVILKLAPQLDSGPGGLTSTKAPGDALSGGQLCWAGDLDAAYDRT